MSTIHQFPTPLPVHTPFGSGECILLIDYGLDVNSVWLVRLRGGMVKHFYSDDIRLYGNPMDGLGFDIHIPSNWHVQETVQSVQKPVKNAKGKGQS